MKTAEGLQAARSAALTSFSVSGVAGRQHTICPRARAKVLRCGAGDRARRRRGLAR
jgi:hypothetical protein